MDRRTFLYVFLFLITIFFINYYFEQQHQESVRKWQEQQHAKNLQKKEELEKEIAQQTAEPEKLPIVELYRDQQGDQFISYGIEIDGTILTLSSSASNPPKIYRKKLQETQLQEYHLVYDPKLINQPLLYSAKIEPILKISSLPDFGKYSLQIVMFPKDQSKTLSVLLGHYVDGHLSIPQEKLEQLNRELQETVSSFPHTKNQLDGIALLKTQDGYLPTAIYDHHQQDLVFLEEFTELTRFLKKSESKTITSQQKAPEKFYVLENEYQQLVFSNYGAALLEINLPFQAADDDQSVVKEIEFDRDIVQHHPYNALFPAHTYYTPGENPAQDFIEHQKGKLGGYYPLLRRDLIESAQYKSVRVPIRFYALNVVSEYPEVAELIYEVKYFDKNKIVFEANQLQRRITKTFSLSTEKQAPYCFDLTISIEGDSRGLWLTSGVPEVEWISGGPAPALKYRITRHQKANVENIDLPQDALTVSSVYPDWICNSNGFLGMILDPLTEINPGYRVQHVPGVMMPSRLVEIEQEYNRFSAKNMPGYSMMLPLKSQGGTMQFRIFAGPFAESVLKKIDRVYSDPKTGYNPDYIACQTFHGWFAFISEPFAKFLFILMKFFQYLTGSWGISIILLTIALRLMLYPLNAWSTKSMLRMQQISPEITAIQERHKKDPKQAQLEIMKLYRERGVNPLSGCFPILIQMPFLVGMFDLLKSTFELRGAGFIPGWIDNLTAPDVLFSWNQPIFFIGNQFHLLPFLLGAVMFLQQRFMSTAPKDPNLMTDQQRQQRAMGTMMTVVFTLMFYHFPSGLNIYWLSSTVLGILQQWWTGFRLSKKKQLGKTQNSTLVVK